MIRTAGVAPAHKTAEPSALRIKSPFVRVTKAEEEGVKVELNRKVLYEVEGGTG